MTEINISDLFQAAIRVKRSEITAAIYSWSRGKVQSGPFRGMRILQASSWGDGDLCPKILGTYESELHPCLNLWTKAQPDMVINIGCAEGFYAVGLARLFDGAIIKAFDISPAARDLCQRNAALNRVQDRIVVDGLCSPEILDGAVRDALRPAVVCDCEGGELDLLDPVRAPSLSRCNILVECHDFVNRFISETLVARFKESHVIDAIPEGPRDPNRFTPLRRMRSLDRWLAVCEFRPESMNWLFMRPRSVANT
ncbi:hypothetical protein [Desulfolutivibrio sp.]|uniref:hypothetical protein n=1 Tax=Desulfolutivibrio sp. TaxID=2773296 RepID=UPI002F967501